MSSLSYAPQVFDVASLGDAMNIILTPEGGETTEERWHRETPHVVDLILENCSVDASTVVIDYGCGVGRVAKEIIRRTGCSVIGADISANMRALSAHYVNSPRFISCHPSALALMPKASVVISIWTLQHCFDVEGDVSTISSSLSGQGQVFTVNNLRRAIPVIVEGSTAWVDDGKNVDDLLSAAIGSGRGGQLDERYVSDAVKQAAGWAVYRK